jgi:hypothetical protein
MTENAPIQPTGDVVARVDFQYRWRTWALFLLLLVFGLWCLRDGFFVWPRENAAWSRRDAKVDRPPKPPHETSSVLFNQVFGVGLTLLSIPVFAWRAHKSRGEYRLSGNTLSVPGHPPISLEQIRGLDLVQWDRKGIATVEYETAGGPHRSLQLQDMIYERRPTDRIVKRIEDHLEAQDASPEQVTQPSQ